MSRGRRTGVRGSVRQMRSGNWQARLPKDLDPWTRPLGTTFPTRAHAEVALGERIQEIEAGRVVLADPHIDPRVGPRRRSTTRTVSHMMDDLMCEHTTLATHTRRCYTSLIDSAICHPEHGLGDEPVASLDKAAIRRWQDRLRAEGKGETSMDRAFAVLRAGLSHEEAAGRIGRNPALGARKPSTKAARAARTRDDVRLPTWEQVHEMAAAIPNWNQRLMFLLLAFGGMRISELCAIEPGSLLHATREIDLTHVWTKLRNGPWIEEILKNGEPRTVFVPHGLWTHLAAHADAWTPPIPRRAPVLFPRPNATRGGPGFWEPMCWRARVILPMNTATGLDFRTKDLRAYAVSALVDVGATEAEAKQLLGHEDAKTTHQHYIRALDARAHDPARSALRMNPLLSLPERLDALWDAFVDRFDDPLAPENFI